MGDDEIVRTGGGERAGIGEVSAETGVRGRVGCGDPSREEGEHCRAEIDGIGFEMKV